MEPIFKFLINKKIVYFFLLVVDVVVVLVCQTSTTTTSTRYCICSYKYILLAQEIKMSNRFYCITKQSLNILIYLNNFMEL